MFLYIKGRGVEKRDVTLMRGINLSTGGTEVTQTKGLNLKRFTAKLLRRPCEE